jgi:pyruvate/2-oxoglutarate dehydrogenase complex dihydrolipoamide acyltransferase (E2) component
MTSTAVPSGPAVRISPYAKRLAVQRGLAVADLVGTGPGGEIGAKDVRRAVAAAGVGSGYVSRRWEQP